MNNTNGIIAEQSKKKIAEAMLKVMNTYDYKEITVTQITQEARISRKTFYRHFRDKDEVLKHLFDSLYQECLSSITGCGIHHYWDVVQLFFDFWEKHAETLNLMKRSNLLPQLFEESYTRTFKKYGSKFNKKMEQDYEGVTLVTAHSSKGMEWPIVYLSLSSFDNETLSNKKTGCHLAV